MERNSKGESRRYIQWKEKDKTKAVATLNGKKQTKRKRQLDTMRRNKQGESNSWTQEKEKEKTKAPGTRNGK